MLLCRAVPRRQSHREWPRDNRSSKQRLVTTSLRNICAGKKNCRFVWWTLGKNLQKFFECWISRTAQSYAWIYLHHRKKARYVFQTTNYWYLKKRQEYPSDGKCTHILQLSFTPHKFIKEFSSTSSKKIPLRFIDILFKEFCFVWWSLIKSNSCQDEGGLGE